MDGPEAADTGKRSLEDTDGENATKQIKLEEEIKEPGGAKAVSGVDAAGEAGAGSEITEETIGASAPVGDDKPDEYYQFTDAAEVASGTVKANSTEAADEIATSSTIGSDGAAAQSLREVGSAEQPQQNAAAAKEIDLRMIFDGKTARVIIGKDAATIKVLREASGCRVHLSDSIASERVATIGGTVAGISLVTSMIGNTIVAVAISPPAQPVPSCFPSPPCSCPYALCALSGRPMCCLIVGAHAVRRVL
jgi:hypothetical protein